MLEGSRCLCNSSDGIEFSACLDLAILAKSEEDLPSPTGSREVRTRRVNILKRLINLLEGPEIDDEISVDGTLCDTTLMSLKMAALALRRSTVSPEIQSAVSAGM